MKFSVRHLMLISSLIFSISMAIFPNKVLAQNQKRPGEVKFLIVIEKTTTGVKLTGKEGCSWKELEFTLNINHKQAIDQNGMTDLNNKSSKSLSTFLFTLERTKTNIKLVGIAGTSWENLSFSFNKNNLLQAIDQDGMTKLE